MSARLLLRSLLVALLAALPVPAAWAQGALPPVTLNAASTDCATAGSCVEFPANTVGVLIDIGPASGTFEAEFEMLSGVTWRPLTLAPIAEGPGVEDATAVGTWRGTSGGKVRVRLSTCTTCVVRITLTPLVDPPTAGSSSATLEGDITVDNVTVTSSALPTGAATEATLAGVLTSTNFAAAFGTAGSADSQVLSVQGIASGTPLVVGDGSGALNTIVDSGTITAVTTVTNPVTVTDGAGALNVIVDSGTVTTVSTVTNLATIGTSVTPGVSAAHLGKAEDAVAGSGDTGVAALWVRADTAASSGANGDYVTPISDSTGRLWVNPGTIGVEDAAETAAGNLAMIGTVRRDSAASSAGTTGDNATANTDANGLLWVRIGASDVSSSGGTSAADDADFVDGTTAGTPIGGVAESASPTTVTEGDFGWAAITLNRALKVTLFSAAGAELTPSADWTIGTAIATTAPGGTAVYSDFDGSALPTVANVDTEGEAVPIAASIKGVQYVMLASEDGSLQYGTSTTPLVVGDGSGALNVICDSGCGSGTVYDQGEAITLGSANGVISGGRVSAAAPSTTGVIDDDFAALWVRNTGEQVIGGSGAAGTAATGVVTVQGIASMTPILATVTATNLDVQIGGSDTLSVNPGTATNWGVYVEDAAETGGANLQMLGTVRRDSAASSAGTTGDNATANTDGNGLLWVRIGASDVSSSGGTSLADDADFTTGTTAFTPVGGLYQSTVTACTDGDTCAAGITTQRTLKTTLFSAAGAELTPATDATTGTAVPTTGPLSQRVYSDFDGSALPTLTNVDTEGEAVPAAASIKGVSYVMLVSEDGALERGTSTTPLIVGDGTGALNVICDSGCAGGTQYAEDSARSSGDTVTLAGAVRQDTLATDTSTDGDAAFLKSDAAGRLYIFQVGIGVEDAAETTGAGLQMIGATRRDTALSSCSANNENCNVNVDALGRMWISGAYNEDGAHASTDIGLAVLTRRIDVPATSAGTDADYATFNSNASGALWVSQVDPCSSETKTTDPFSLTARGVIIAAAASKKNYICSIVVIAGAAEIGNVVEGTGTTCQTGTAAIAGSTTAANGLSFPANGGFSSSGGNATVLAGKTANVDTCLVPSGSNRLAGFVTWVQR